MGWIKGHGLDKDPIGFRMVRIDVSWLRSDAQIMAPLIGVSLSVPDLDPQHGGPGVCFALVVFDVCEGHDGNSCFHQIAGGREKTKSARQRITRAERITSLRPNLLGRNCVTSYPAKRAAVPLFRNSQPKGTRPLSKPRCALRLPCAGQGPNDLQPGLAGHADDACHGGVHTRYDRAGINRAESRG